MGYIMCFNQVRHIRTSYGAAVSVASSV